MAQAGRTGAISLPLRSARMTGQRWPARDWIAASVLFTATAAVILWQNAHLAALWDLSYVLDTADRFALGQMPYRDFPLVHPPLPFLIQAALIRIAGRVYWPHIAYVAAMGGLGTVLTWRIALESLRGRIRAVWPIAWLLAAPLAVLGIYCILPHPSYDCDCAFWMLVSVWSLQRLEPGNPSRGFAAGALACLPLFFKQNMGLPFLAAVVLAAVALLVVRGIGNRTGSDVRVLWAMLAGIASALAAAELALHFTAGIGNYLHWTIEFAGQRRMPGFRAMLGVYLAPGLLWTLPCVIAGVLLLRFGRSAARWNLLAGFALLIAPFVWTLYSLVFYENPDARADALLALWPMLLILAAAAALCNLYRLRNAVSLRALLPFVLLAGVNGTFMSQQLWGSTYAIWPLLVLLGAGLLVELDQLTARGWLTPAIAAVFAATLLVCGASYLASEDRLSYTQFPSGPPVHSAYPQLAGLATPGEYLPEFDELLRYSGAHIPFDDGLILIPGEDPFYFATGRVPRFPVLLFDPSTDPYSPDEVAALVRSRGIRWLIVKRDLQISGDPTPDRAALMAALMREFSLAARLRGYDVYRR